MRTTNTASSGRTLPDSSTPFNLSSLQEISKVLGASLELNKLLQVILTTMLNETQASSGSLLLYDEQRKELAIHAAQGIPASIVKKTRIKLGQGIAGTVAQSQKPLIIDDRTFFSLTRARPTRGIKSSLCLPLVINKKLIGVLNLNRVSRAREFTAPDLEIMNAFARQSALAIHNAQLYIDAEEKIQYLFRFNVISSALNAAFNREEILSILVDCVQQLFPYDFFTLLLLEGQDHDVFMSSRIPVSAAMTKTVRANLSLVASDILKRAISPSDLQITLDPDRRPKLRKRSSFSGTPVSSFMNAPLIAKEKILGMLSICALAPETFTQKHQQSLSTLAAQAAVALENAALYRSLRQTYISTIKALAQAIEEKDEYTRGHSEMVSQYAVTIGGALGLPKSFNESLQIAGILHDIGKIGIPENILRKPGKLTAEEYDIIKTHPQIGKRILAPVDFLWSQSPQSRERLSPVPASRQLTGSNHIFLKTMEILQTTDVSQEIKTMIYHHHERIDGAGYPDGLRDRAIPLGSRILAVADTFEAMTSERPYRKAFPVAQALKLLKDCTPTQLDDKIVSIFIDMVKRKKVPVPIAR